MARADVGRWKPAVAKLGRMAELYLVSNGTMYAEADRRGIERAVVALQRKFALADFHLEALWAISLDRRAEVVGLLERSATVHRWPEGQDLEPMAHLEAFLFQARALLDFYFHLACRVCSVSGPLHMSVKIFSTRMAAAEPPHVDRAIAVRAYVERHVLSPGAWGELLRSLRDRVAHAEHLTPGRQGGESVAGIRLDWPTIRGLTLDRLAQQFGTGTFELLRDTSPILFDLPWRNGPYDPNAWQAPGA